MRISACYIVRNEEKNLPKSLESIKSNVDEIIVVDTGSDDNTVKIAKKYGAKVFHQEWQDDFSFHRNYALTKATGDWIIFLDADEYFSTPEYVRSSIKEIALANTCEGIIVPLINIDVNNKNKRDQWIDNDGVVRIWRNCSNFRFIGCIHENLYKLTKKNSISPLNLYRADKRLTLYHTGYSCGIVSEKINRYLSMIKKEISIKGIQPLSYRYLADCYLIQKKYDKAIVYAQKAIDYENELGVITISGQGKLYRYILESAKELGWSVTKIIDVAQKALQTTKEDINSKHLIYYIKNMAAELSCWEFYTQLIKEIPGQRDIYELLNGYLDNHYILIDEIDFLIRKRQEKMYVALQGLKGKEEYKSDYESWYQLIPNDIKLEKDEVVNRPLEEILASLQKNIYDIRLLRKFVAGLGKAKIAAEEQISLLNSIYKKEDANFIANTLGYSGGKLYIYYAKRAGLPLDTSDAFLAAGKSYAAAMDLDMEISLLRRLRRYCHENNSLLHNQK